MSNNSRTFHNIWHNRNKICAYFSVKALCDMKCKKYSADGLKRLTIKKKQQWFNVHSYGPANKEKLKVKTVGWNHMT